MNYKTHFQKISFNSDINKGFGYRVFDFRKLLKPYLHDALFYCYLKMCDNKSTWEKMHEKYNMEFLYRSFSLYFQDHFEIYGSFEGWYEMTKSIANILSRYIFQGSRFFWA